jgi:hypothetical protein
MIGSLPGCELVRSHRTAKDPVIAPDWLVAPREMASMTWLSWPTAAVGSCAERLVSCAPLFTFWTAIVTARRAELQPCAAANACSYSARTWSPPFFRQSATNWSNDATG